ncbi:MAG: glutamine-hydrolyzing carbamoyl-phosphate synthase small subunit [Candidatus Omnitrophica bacterium]|nr:glutamine-hydrolyzing carbamoyl-phosphate synthase small subunit [Candidatus Omnitrophota bacterium]
MSCSSPKAKIALEDGRVFNGVSFGAKGEAAGEVVFNTSLTGYQEILTDPSYRGQIVTLTYPLIGNYGINKDFSESRSIFLQALVVKECSKIASNWQSEQNLSDYLKTSNIIGIEGVDTRALTRHIRLQGAMKAIVSTEDFDDVSLVKKAKASRSLEGANLVKEVSCSKAYEWSKSGECHVVAIDCGIKHNILRILQKKGCKLTVVPYATTAGDILAMKPDGLFLSNGPGDPAAVECVVKTVKELIGKFPIFGICLGHQMIGLALGGTTYKLKFGHHGGNHPVKDLKTGKISITAQNHGFCVDIDSLNKDDIEITHINLNDNTLEGIQHKKEAIFSVQFHPESSPGPHDARYLFDEFISMMKNNQ